MRSALKTLERTLHRNHPDRIESVRLYAKLLRARGDEREAQRYEARIQHKATAAR